LLELHYYYFYYSSSSSLSPSSASHAVSFHPPLLPLLLLLPLPLLPLPALPLSPPLPPTYCFCFLCPLPLRAPLHIYPFVHLSVSVCVCVCVCRPRPSPSFPLSNSYDTRTQLLSTPPARYPPLPFHSTHSHTLSLYLSSPLVSEIPLLETIFHLFDSLEKRGSSELLVEERKQWGGRRGGRNKKEG